MLSDQLENKKISYNIAEIMGFIPHRYPFLLIDKVTDCVPGKYIKGYKNVTINEPFFQGHFPNNPIMPGVLLIEALAQLSATLLKSMPGQEDKLILFAGIDKARFKKIVVPGDKLEMCAEVLKCKGPIVTSKCNTTVDGQIVMVTELMCAIQKITN